MSRRERCISIAGLTAITLVALHSQARHLFSVPDRGDPLFSMWRIAWVQHQIIADPAHLFDANIFYPLRATLTYSDAMILPALAAAPLSWIGVHPIAAYNSLLLASFVLTGFAMYVLVRALDWGGMAAWVAAVAFMLSSFRLNHFSHLELQMEMWMPLVLLGVVRLLQTGEWKYVAGLAGALAAQWYSSMYFGLFLTLYAVVFGAVLVFAWKVPLRRIALTAAAFVLAGIAVLPLSWAYVQSEPARGERQVRSIIQFSATPSDYLRPPPATPAYRRFLLPSRQGERALFPGVVPLLLLVVSLWPPLSAFRVAFFVAGLVAFDGSTGLHGVLYPLLYKVAFPFHSIRVPARFGALVLISTAALAGYGASRLLSRLTDRRARMIGAAVITAGLMVDGWPRYDSVPVWKSPPSIYQSLPASAVLFEFPVHGEPARFVENLPYMYFSMWHWHPMVNGYSGFNPAAYAELLEGTREFPAPPALDYLRRLGVTHVTVHCALWDLDVCVPTTARLDRDPSMRLVVRAAWAGAPSSLYEIRKATK